MTPASATASQSRRRPVGAGPLGRCASVALLVLAVDVAAKVVAASVLGAGQLQLTGRLFLRVVHNPSFARGIQLGEHTLLATLLLATVVLLVIGRVCRALTEIDRSAPLALGLIAGAAAGNAADFLRTGRGAVDFLGVATGGGHAIIFNLADVAAYAGVALLARTVWRVGAAIARERQLDAPPRYPRLRAAALAVSRRGSPHLELVQPLPVFVEPNGATRDTEVSPDAERSPTAPP